MKFYKITLAILLMVTISTSCKKYLDENPSKGKVIANSVVHFKGLLNTIYNALYTNYTTILMADDVALDPTITDYDKSVLASYQFQTNSFWAKDIWLDGYQRINIFNTVIDHVMAAEVVGTPAEKEQVQAMAYVLRGIEYFSLVNVFSLPYKAGTANDAAGVPLVLHADINARVGSRETVKKVYNQLLVDILDYIDKLPVSTGNAREITQQGAMGMLARIYLQMQDYKNARLMAERALAISKPMFDYNDILFSTPGDYYAGFSNSPNYLTWPDAIYTRINDGMGSGNFYMSPELDDLYKDGDLRRSIYFYNKRSNGDLFPVGWYFAPGDQPQVGFRNIGIGTPELQLIIAEAAARNGTPADLQVALSHLKSLRKLRFTPADYEDLVSVDAREVLQWVMEERRRELFFTPMRFFDLKRLNLDPAFRKTVVHQFGPASFTLEATSPLYQPLIPLEAFLNADITQNPQ